MIFPFLRVLCLADSNHTEMDQVYYYSRMTKKCIEKKHDIDYQKLLPDINKAANICNMSDDESEK